MNKKVRENYELLAQAAGLKLDEESGVIYGNRGGYSMVLYAQNSSYPYQFSVNVSAKNDQNVLTKKECKQFAKENKTVASLILKGNLFTMFIKGKGNQSKLRENVMEALNAFTAFLQTNRYQNCCQACGKTEDTDVCGIGSSHMLLCEECFVAMGQNAALKEQQKAVRKENVIGGIVGALLGTLLGVGCIILLSQAGYVAALSGIVMAVCTLKGYELLGGRISRKGVIICVLLMLVMTYVGDRLDWAIMIMRELETDLATSYQIVPILLQESVIDGASYWGNLFLVNLFLLLGAVPTVRNIIKNQEQEGRVCRLGAGAAEGVSVTNFEL